MSNLVKGAIAGVTIVAAVAVLVLFFHGRNAPKTDMDALSAGLPAGERDAYIASAIPSCKATAKSDQRVIDAHIAPEAIDQYCHCVAEKSANAMSVGEMNAIAAAKTLPDSFNAKIQNIAKACGVENLKPAQ